MASNETTITVLTLATIALIAIIAVDRVAIFRLLKGIGKDVKEVNTMQRENKEILKKDSESVKAIIEHLEQENGEDAPV